MLTSKVSTIVDTLSRKIAPSVASEAFCLTPPCKWLESDKFQISAFAVGTEIPKPYPNRRSGARVPAPPRLTIVFQELFFVIELPLSTVWDDRRLARSLATSGLRFTKQRQKIFDVVAASHDHPTAEEILARARNQMPEISFATVYNCLSVLAQCGLIRQVTLDRSPTRFCPNMREHCHFYCEGCGEVTDINVPPSISNVALPGGFTVVHWDVSLRGRCPKCGGGAGAAQIRT